MSNLEEELCRWGKELETVHLPRWDELPDFHLYMDQVISLIHDYLAFNQMKSDEKLITPAMINNYVKLKIIPKPLKKRYTRIHLAHLVIIFLLKPVLAIGEIKAGISLQVVALHGDYRAAYNLFCKQYECTLHYIARVAQGQYGSDPVMEKLPVDMLGAYMANLSIASKLFSQKVLAILEEEAAQGVRNSDGIRGQEGKKEYE